MSESASTPSHARARGVPFHERAFAVGDLIGVNAYRINRATLKRRLSSGDYLLRETPHFLLASRTASPTLLVHWFAPQAINADLGSYFMQELRPLGALEGPRDFGAAFGAVVGSLFPADNPGAWHLYAVNTLQRYLQLLAARDGPARVASPIEVFATLYRRVCALQMGESLLDAGCSFGFLPLLVGERIPSLERVVGVDILAESFPITRAIALERNLIAVQFAQADLLAADLGSLGTFASVCLLHVLEHFTQTDMYRVLANLLPLVERRLIIAVPYEGGQPERVYGHEQLFSREKLEDVGRWCLQRLGGGHLTLEECAGGLLVVER